MESQNALKVRDITRVLEVWAPPVLQESYDNSGLLVGNPNAKVTKVLVSLDCTEEVVAEAEQEGAEMIVSHHPIIFSGLKSLTGRSYVERTVLRAIKSGIVLYSIHTNLDNVITGVNQELATALGCTSESLEILRLTADEDKNIGAGIIGVLPHPMKWEDFLDGTKKALNASHIKHTKAPKEMVSRIAVCGGSGSFLLCDALANNADVFVTSDFKYHEYFDADGKILIVDVGHYESEWRTSALIANVIKHKFTKFAVRLTSVNTNPVQIR